MILKSDKDNITIEDRKIQLLSIITQVNSNEVLDSIEKLFLNSEPDWWTTLSKPEQFAIDEGLTDIENGKLLQHSNVIEEINNRYKDL